MPSKSKSTTAAISIQSTGLLHAQFIQGIHGDSDGCIFQVFQLSEAEHEGVAICRAPNAAILHDLCTSAPHKLRDWIQLVYAGHDTIRSVTDFVDFITPHAIHQHVPYLSDPNATPLGVRIHALGTRIIQLLHERTENDAAKLIESWTQPDPDTRELPLVPIARIFEAIPGFTEGLKSHTLIFRPELWTVCPSPVPTTVTHVYHLMQHTLTELPEPHVVARGAPVATVHIRSKCNAPQHILLTEGDDWRATASTVPAPMRASGHDALALVCEIFPDIPWRQADSVLRMLERFTPGILKSVMQKCIRYGAVHTEFADGQRVPTDLLAVCAFVTLMHHPGTFVPDARRVVKGSESALKRLAMCMVEDSYHTCDWMCTLCLAALAARHSAQFTDTFLLAVMQAVKDTQRDMRSYFMPKWHEAKTVSGNYARSAHSFLMSDAMFTLRSFPGDMAMFDDLAMGKLSVRAEPAWPNRPAIMPFCHFIDHHCVPDVVHFLDLPALQHVHPVEQVSEMIQFLWTHGTSRNYRMRMDYAPHPLVTEAQWRYMHCKMPDLVPNLGGTTSSDGDGDGDDNDHPWWDDMTDLDTPRGMMEIPRGLHPAALAGICSMTKLTVHGMGAYWTFLDPHNLTRTITMPAGRNATAETTVPEMAQKIAHADFVNRTLHAKKNGIATPDDWQLTGTLRMRRPRDDTADPEITGFEYVPKRPRRADAAECGTIDWHDLCEERIPISTVGHPEDWTAELPTRDQLCRLATHIAWKRKEQAENKETRDDDAPIYADVMMHRWRDTLNVFLAQLPTAAIGRIQMYLSTVNDRLAPFRPNRSGKGIDQSVHIHDTDYMHFLLLCSNLAPVALQLSTESAALHVSFQVTNHSVWQAIKQHVLQYYAGAMHTTRKSRAAKKEVTWLSIMRDQVRALHRDAEAATEMEIETDPEFQFTMLDARQRAPMPHQLHCMEHIVERAKRGERGTIFWSPVGTGKTYAVIGALLQLAVLHLLPPVVVFAVPESAVATIETEMQAFGLPTKIVNPGKTKTQEHQRQFAEFTVNLITHDRLKHVHSMEQIHARSSEVFLVVDEMHLLMARGTIRTSSGLELCKTVNNFVAMTGTIIRDRQATGVPEWIGQVVPFKVTKANVYPAMTFAVSNRYDLHVEERAQLVDVQMTESEMARYQLLVDRALGGRAEQTNLPEAFRLCYEVTERELIAQTMACLARGESVVMLVAKDGAMQQRLDEALVARGVKTFAIKLGNTIYLDAHTPTDIQVVITTMKYVTGYTLTKAKTMITGVYFSNQCNRTQLTGRILRMGQPSPYVDIITVHCGVLSYTLQYYNEAKNLEAAISKLAEII